MQITNCLGRMQICRQYLYTSILSFFIWMKRELKCCNQNIYLNFRWFIFWKITPLSEIYTGKNMGLRFMGILGDLVQSKLSFSITKSTKTCLHWIIRDKKLKIIRIMHIICNIKAKLHLRLFSNSLLSKAKLSHIFSDWLLNLRYKISEFQ